MPFERFVWILEWARTCVARCAVGEGMIIAGALHVRIRWLRL